MNADKMENNNQLDSSNTQSLPKDAGLNGADQASRTDQSDRADVADKAPAKPLGPTGPSSSVSSGIGNKKARLHTKTPGNKKARLHTEKPDDKKARLRKAFLCVWTVIGVCILCGLAIYLLNVLALPVSLFIWTMVIVFSLRGIVDVFDRHGIKRVVGTALAYIMMFAILALIGFLMFSPMSGLNEQFANIISNIPRYISEVSKWAAEMSEKYSDILNNEQVRNALGGIVNSVSSWSSSFASDAANTAINVGTGIGNAFYAIGFALVIAFWILMELPAMGRESMKVISPKYTNDLIFLNYTFTRILGGYIKGTIAQCFIIGLCCGILFAIAGIPNAPALGVITGVLNIIPIIGPWLGGAVAALTAIFVSPWAVLIALIGTIIIQQFVYTFISPKIMSNSVDIHPALTLVAMIFGSAIGGAMSGLMGSLVGMLLAIPFVAVIKACFIYYFERVTGRQIVAADGFLFKGTPSKDCIDPLFDATSGALSKTDIACKAEADAEGESHGGLTDESHGKSHGGLTDGPGKSHGKSHTKSHGKSHGKPHAKSHGKLQGELDKLGEFEKKHGFFKDAKTHADTQSADQKQKDPEKADASDDTPSAN